VKLRGRGILALAAPALLVAFTVWDRGFRSAVLEPLPPVAAASLPGPLPIAIVQSEVTSRCLGQPPGYAAHAAYWQSLLRDAGHSAVLLDDAGMASGFEGYAAVVLPSVVCLGDAARRAVTDFVNAGGGLVATWALGTHGADGQWRGWDLLTDLTGALRFADASGEPPWFVSVASASPLGAGAPGAARFQVSSRERVEATALDVDAYWSDARLFPRLPSLPPEYQAAALHREKNAGRVAWLGFHENAAPNGPDAARLDALLRNAVAWAARRPLVSLEPWPTPHASAALIAVHVDQHPNRARLVASALAKARSVATFFLDPGLVTDRELLRELAATGELALTWPPPHADGSLESADRLRLQAARFSLWWRSSAWATGTRPAGDALPSGLPQLLAGAGARYSLAGGGVDSVLPGARRVRRGAFSLSTEDALVALARSADDDLHLSPLGLTGLSTDWIASRFLADAEIVSRLGGLYVLSIHTQGLGGPEYTPALRASLEGLSRGGAWVAGAGELVRWWADRGLVRLRVAGSTNELLGIQVGSAARRPIDGLSLLVHAGAPLRSARLTGTSGTAGSLRVVAVGNGERARLSLPRLEAGRTLSLELTFGR
jgi:hypothetical protein